MLRPQAVSRKNRIVATTAAAAALCALGAACARPADNPDGKPVALSPMRSDNSVTETALPKAPASPVKKTAETHSTGAAKADFAAGKFDGIYVQDRCADSLRTTTTLKGLTISLRHEVFDDTACKSPVETTQTAYELRAIKGTEADLVPTKETKTLFLDSELARANDATAPDCAAGWEKGVERDISALGDCTTGDPLFTLLELNATDLRWGAPGQNASSGEVLDGSSAAKRHAVLEALPAKKTDTK